MPTPDQGAIAFGTWAMAVHGIDNIEREQWRKVWPRIRGFTFEPKPVVRANADTAWIAAGWQSEATGADGKLFTRPGRATFILARGEGRWQCVHSHVSLQPTQSESAHGKLGSSVPASTQALIRQGCTSGAIDLLKVVRHSTSVGVSSGSPQLIRMPTFSRRERGRDDETRREMRDGIDGRTPDGGRPGLVPAGGAPTARLGPVGAARRRPHRRRGQ